MNAISRIASLLSLAAVAQSDSHEDEHELTVSILATWDSFEAGLYIATESVEYNADDDLWYFGNWYGNDAGQNATDSKQGEVGSLSGAYPVETQTDFDLQEDIMSAQAFLPSGMVYSDGYLYQGDFAGQLHKFDTSDNSYVASADLNDLPVNGVCMDEENNMLYVTTTGWDFDTYIPYPERSGLFSVDPDTLEVTRLYDGSASEFPDAYVFNPNGCYVNDGQVYMVDVQLAAAGSLGIYDIDSGNFTRDAVVLAGHSVCDGIVYYDGVWFVTDVFNGQLLALNTYEDDAIFEVVLSNLTGAADICLGPDNTIAIPSVGEGTIWFAQFEIGHNHDSHDHDSSDENSAGRLCIISVLAIIAAALF